MIKMIRMIIGTIANFARSGVSPETVMNQKSVAGVKATKAKPTDDAMPNVHAKRLSSGRCRWRSPMRAIATSW